VKHSSIRILLALIAQYNYELNQLNVKTAFLHGDLEEEIYITQPLGFRTAEKEKLVFKLQKPFYGLKQSPRLWYKRFDKFMIGFAYTRSLYDTCVYFRKVPSGECIYLLLYVDDMLIGSTNRSSIDKLKARLSLAFEIMDLGEGKRILGMEIDKDWVKGKLSLTWKALTKGSTEV